MKANPILLSACLLAGCASGPVVQTDRDPGTDFSRFHDYAWKQPPPVTNPLLRQRIVAAIDAQLAGKGWRQVPEAEADVLLVGNVSAREDVALNYFYDGNAWAGWDWHPYGNRGAQRVELRSYRVGTLVLDMFDAQSRRAVWRGVAEGTVPDSEARRTRDAMTAVERLFEGFPPPTLGAAR